MVKYLLRVACMAFVFIAFFCSCKHEQPFRIAVSQCSADDWREKMNEEIRREAMFHDDVEVEIRSADDSSEKQIADLEYFANAGFDLIIVSPNQADALTPIIKRLYEGGMPIILFDRTINGDSYTAYRGADNRAIGVLAARLAHHYAPGGKVIEIEGLMDSSPASMRAEGFDSCAAASGMQIVGRARADWNYDDALVAADSLLAAHPDVDIIFAHNDRMAIGAAETARRKGLGNVRVIGVDAAPKIGIQAVADSVIDATFLYPTQGEELVLTALAILKGEPYERDVLFPSPSAVDLSNAEILLLQDRALNDETDKINTLKGKIDIVGEQHSLQTAILYGLLLILLLTAALLFAVLRTYWANVRHRNAMEAKNAELERQHRELDSLYRQLQSATASKLTFFTNVSHDLRTPLTLIADPVEQLAEAPNLTAQQHTLAKLANKNVKVLMRLINQILDFRKYENGKLALSLASVDLAREVAEWAHAFEHVAVKKHIGFSLDIDPEGDYRTDVDPGKMERVLFNLLSNAFKFTPANGKIAVRLRSDGGQVLLTVADTGRGMSAEELGHVFERFYMADKIDPQGSGIGLAVTKAFVELHGGTIKAESELGKGTAFVVAIPIAHGAPAAEAAAPKAITAEAAEAELADIDTEMPEADPDAKTVLVIDDNRDILTLVKSLLSDKYVVMQASGGLQGIKLATKYVPDLVICDVMMPGIDGMETCRRLKHEMATSHIPVLMLTACALDEQRVEGYDCGADGYLTKPFNSRVLLARCESLIANRRLVLQAAGKAPAPGKSPDAPAQHKPASPDASLDNEFYKKFAAIVERELANSEISVEDIASELGMSRVQMYRKLKAITNYSPAEIIRNLRLQRADRLLKTTDQNVSEVAYAVGFTSPSYFTKCYREYFGESPSDAQKRTGQKQ